MKRRLYEHFGNRGKKETFAGEYYCYNLAHYEHFVNINEAIKREKELKGWSRKKKEDLIRKGNPEMNFIQLD